MRISYDPAKNEKNIAKHGLDFDFVGMCDWDIAVITPDKRNDYAEKRYNALVLLNNDLKNVTFTKRDGMMRIISFRKANKKERKNYAQKN